jgi:hypothetical protein
MGFQVDQATHKFWLNEVAIWDLRLMEKKGGKKEREIKKERKKRKKRKKRKGNRKRKIVRSLDEWILSKLG